MVKKENCDTCLMILCNYHIRGSLVSSIEQFWKIPSSDYSSQQLCKANTRNPILILFCKWENTCISKRLTLAFQVWCGNRGHQRAAVIWSWFVILMRSSCKLLYYYSRLLFVPHNLFLLLSLAHGCAASS